MTCLNFAELVSVACVNKFDFRGESVPAIETIQPQVQVLACVRELGAGVRICQGAFVNSES